VKKYVINGFLVLAATILMAVFFEVMCRTLLNSGTQYHVEMWKYALELKRIAEDPEIGHEHEPGTSARLMGVDVAINAAGLRNSEVEFAKPSDITRVLMLGDSITFGWGVPFEKTMSRVLERKLNDRSQQSYEVINTGVGNYNTAMEASYFFHRGKVFEPDIVVLNYFINDAELTPKYESANWIARHSYAYAIVGGAWDGLKRRVLGEADWRDYYKSLYADGAPGWRLAQKNIARLADYCRANGVRFIIAHIPELRELADYPFTDVTNKLESAAASHHVEFVDLLPAVIGQDPAYLWVSEPDPHPNARAHEYMGRYLVDYLMDAPGRLALDE
jgi:lysophospholipase L1-like esterase